MTARTHRATSTTNRAIIMTFVTRSTPFCTPARVTPTPTPTMMSMYTASCTGSASKPLKTSATWELSSPTNSPEALFTTKASIQPPTVV